MALGMGAEVVQVCQCLSGGWFALCLAWRAEVVVFGAGPLSCPEDALLLRTFLAVSPYSPYPYPTLLAEWSVNWDFSTNALAGRETLTICGDASGEIWAPP